MSSQTRAKQNLTKFHTRVGGYSYPMEHAGINGVGKRVKKERIINLINLTFDAWEGTAFMIY